MSSTAFFPAELIDRHRHPLETGAFLRSSNDDNDSPGNWDSPGRLTLSFAADGTNIAGYESSLYETFAGMLDAAQLERTIQSAFESWARVSNINVGVVDDSGDPFGIGGASQGDPRFGDVRVGALPMAQDVYAVAIPHNEMLSGTWAGDILFNSNAEFKSVEQVYAVALHEAGHVLGLQHSNHPLSVMHPTRLNSRLFRVDKIAIRDRYGARALDPYDTSDQTNDQFADAVRIRNTGSIDGKIPLVVFGDIPNQKDVDYFYLRPNSGYTGPVTFRVISQTISTLNPTLEIYDENGVLLGQATGTENRGEDLSVTLPSVADDQKYYARVTAAGTSQSVGSYALVTTIDDNLVEGADRIFDIIQGDYQFLQQGDIQDLFLSSVPAFFNNDLHTNDSLATATPLDQAAGAIDPNHFRTQGSLFDLTDVDYYSVDAASSIVTISGVTQGDTQLITNVDLFDAEGNSVASRVVVNGNGELAIQAVGLAVGNTYYVRVSADRTGDPFATGNYLLDVDFARPEFIPNTLATGNISRFANRRVHTMYIAKTQLFHFGLQAGSSLGSPDATIWMSIYDDQGQIVYRVATRPGERRTSKSIVLRPGSYTIRVNYTTPVRERNRWVSYQIDGLGVSDPIGPELVDPAQNPFQPCENDPTNWCYPNDRHSSDPFIIVDGNELPPPVNPPTDPGWMDSNEWYWLPNWPG